MGMVIKFLDMDQKMRVYIFFKRNEKIFLKFPANILLVLYLFTVREILFASLVSYFNNVKYAESTRFINRRSVFSFLLDLL